MTLGVPLLDCVSLSGDVTGKRIRSKRLRVAGPLVKVGRDIETEYGIPIINKRVSVTPIALVAGASDGRDYTPYAKVLDEVAKDLDIDFVGGYSALVQKGFSVGDTRLVDSIPDALAGTDRVCSSVNVATTKNGINMDAVRRMGRVVKAAANLTADRDGIGCAKLVVFCNAPEDNKTTAVRVIPVPGKKVGDWAEFGGPPGGAPIMATHPFSSAAFISRGGRIPAPIHSFRN
jgi:uncharacterized protein (UPF0210 family)